jgi:hypothetical protein
LSRVLRQLPSTGLLLIALVRPLIPYRVAGVLLCSEDVFTSGDETMVKKFTRAETIVTWSAKAGDGPGRSTIFSQAPRVDAQDEMAGFASLFEEPARVSQNSMEINESLGAIVSTNLIGGRFGAGLRSAFDLPSSLNAQAFRRWRERSCARMWRREKSHGWVLITCENSFLSLADENIRPTTPLSMVSTL